MLIPTLHGDPDGTFINAHRSLLYLTANFGHSSVNIINPSKQVVFTFFGVCTLGFVVVVNG